MRTSTASTSSAGELDSEFWIYADMRRIQGWFTVAQIKVRLLTLWAMVAGTSVAAILFAQTVLMGLSFEALTAHKVVSTGEDYGGPGRHLAYVMIPQTRYGGRVYWSLAAVLFGAFLLAVLSGSIWRIISRRWGWRGMVVLTTVMPGILVVLAAGLWYQAAPHLFTWGLSYVSMQALVVAVGHGLGLLAGWRLANLLVWLVLPQSAREAVGMLAYEGLAVDSATGSRSTKSVDSFTTSTTELSYSDSF